MVTINQKNNEIKEKIMKLRFEKDVKKVNTKSKYPINTVIKLKTANQNGTIYPIEGTPSGM